MKYLIVNADDFGRSSSINKGIIEGHTNGIVTSTSLLVYGIAAEEAKDLAQYEKLSLGLHLDLENDEALNIPEEIDRQDEKFLELTGLSPSHIDVHKHRTTDEKVKESLLNYSSRRNIPVRALSGANYIESFYGFDLLGDHSEQDNDLSVESLKKSLNEITPGYNELMCHVGYVDDYLVENSSYNYPRETELKTLCDPQAKDYMEEKGIELVSWNEFPR